MRDGVETLSDKEKETLRLLLAGHDAKSMARHLGLSVHTVNERLRYARRKLSASSSREAARLLREAETTPESLGDKTLGDARAGADGQQGRQPAAGSVAKPRRIWLIGGLVMNSVAVAMLALAASPQPAERAPPSATAPVAETAATQVARQWLALVDAGKWQESWAATAPSFQAANTLQMWQSASEQARVPLGSMLSRTTLSEQSVPAPPNGVRVVRFRTDFANKPAAIETVSLARDGASWRIVGISID